MTYKDKLLDPRWQKKRLEILNRDEFTCQRCGDKKETLHVHHFYYSKEPWDVKDHGLITYCASCHALEEHLISKMPEYEFVDMRKSTYKGFTVMICLMYDVACNFYFAGFKYENNILDFDTSILTYAQYNQINDMMIKWGDFVKRHAKNG